jgi:hypothetical protein
MPGRDAVSAVFPSDALRAALMRSLVAAHHPELADIVAALESGLPVEWIRVLPEIQGTGPGREV